MRWLVGLLIALFAAVGIAHLIRTDAGYVLLSVGGWTIETSVAVLAVVLLVAFVVAYKLIRYTVQVWQLPRELRRSQQRRRALVAGRHLGRGLELLAEGRYAKAEGLLVKAAARSESPAAGLIAAAQAAQALAAPDRRDHYLSKAAEDSRRGPLVVGLADAELRLRQGDIAGATKVLARLAAIAPRNPRVLQLQLQAGLAARDWTRLRALLPALARQRVESTERLAELELQIYREQLAEVGRAGSLGDIHAFWKQLPRAQRTVPALLIDYAGLLRDNDAADQAEELLRKALARGWDDHLVVAYGQLGRGDAARQLEHAQRWLAQHPDNAYLLLTLGRLARRARQLDQARGYLEASIKARPMADTFQELAEVFEGKNHLEAASRCYRDGLRLSTGAAAAPKAAEVLPAPAPEGAQAG